jgi:dipeptidyl aminopeptidase/acylaminoacyl peptidase
MILATALLALKAMTVDDLWTIERVGAPVVSPDGKLAAFSVSVPNVEKNNSNSDLWLVPVDGSRAPRRLTWNDGADGSPAFSPDGRRIAFVSKRGDGPAQLYALSLDGGEAERLTELPIGVEDPKWFPDGKSLAFVGSTWPDLNDDWDAIKKRNEEREKDKVKAKLSENRLWRFWDRYLTDGQFPHIFRVDLETGKVVDLTPGMARYMGLMDLGGGYDIAPDGKEIAFSANATDAPYREMNYDVFVLSVPDGKPVSVTAANPADDTRPRYSPTGRFIVYGRQERPNIDSDFTRLARLDRRSGDGTQLTQEFDFTASDWTISEEGLVYFVAEDHGKVHLHAVPLSGGKPRVLVRGGSIGGPAVAKGGALVFTKQSLMAPVELYRSRPDGTSVTALTHVNDERLKAFDFGRVEDMRFEGAAGDEVQMFVVYPPGHDASRKYPLVQMIHGGPHSSWTDSWSYRWNPLLFAAPGYVVACVNFHGSMGSGQKFADAIVGAHGDKPFTDIMEATDHLIDRRIVDPDRMAAAGGSYGGYLTAWILGHTDRFKALVVHAGVYDLMGQFASDSAYGRSNNYGADPWVDPERIDRYSPSRFASHFSTPTLVIHGEKDYRVPYSQGLNLYGVLTAKGVPARILVYPEENHWVLKAQSAKLWYGEVLGWLERWLRPGSGR